MGKPGWWFHGLVPQLQIVAGSKTFYYWATINLTRGTSFSLICWRNMRLHKHCIKPDNFCFHTGQLGKSYYANSKGTLQSSTTKVMHGVSKEEAESELIQTSVWLRSTLIVLVYPNWRRAMSELFKKVSTSRVCRIARSERPKASQAAQVAQGWTKTS